MKTPQSETSPKEGASRSLARSCCCSPRGRLTNAARAGTKRSSANPHRSSGESTDTRLMVSRGSSHVFTATSATIQKHWSSQSMLAPAWSPRTQNVCADMALGAAAPSRSGRSGTGDGARDRDWSTRCSLYVDRNGIPELHRPVDRGHPARRLLLRRSSWASQPSYAVAHRIRSTGPRTQQPAFLVAADPREGETPERATAQLG
jgi:hypothetical protein